MRISINGDLGFRGGGSLPPAEKLFDNLGNKDGKDWQKWFTFAILKLLIEDQNKKIDAAAGLRQFKELNLLLLSLLKP